MSGNEIYSIGDAVKAHAKEGHMGTSDGLRYLELKHSPENYTAANLYCAALSIIQDLQKRLDDLENDLKSEKMI